MSIFQFLGLVLIFWSVQALFVIGSKIFKDWRQVREYTQFTVEYANALDEAAKAIDEAIFKAMCCKKCGRKYQWKENEYHWARGLKVVYECQEGCEEIEFHREEK